MSDFENQNYNGGTNGDYKWNYEGYGKSPMGSPNNNKNNKKGATIRCLSNLWYRQVTTYSNKHRIVHAQRAWTFNNLFSLYRRFGDFEI